MARANSTKPSCLVADATHVHTYTYIHTVEEWLCELRVPSSLDNMMGGASFSWTGTGTGCCRCNCRSMADGSKHHHRDDLRTGEEDPPCFLFFLLINYSSFFVVFAVAVRALFYPHVVECL